MFTDVDEVRARRGLRIVTVAAASLAGLATLSGPAPQAMADPTNSATAPPLSSGSLFPAPSRLSELHDTEREQSGAVKAARKELTASSRAAAAALEAYSQAVRAQQLAQVEQDGRRKALRAAEETLAVQRAALGRWARQAYRAGNSLASNPTLATVLGEQAADVTQARRWLAMAGSGSDRMVTELEAAQAVRAAAVDAAERAADASHRAVLAAGQAKQARDAAVTAQRATLARLQDKLQTTRDAVAEAEHQAQLLAQARAYAAAHVTIAAGDNRVTGPVGSCTGGDMQLYPNGQIPLAALCPLWAAPGHDLRADAAYAFDQLSTAYAQQFGRPICVTDSYRSYDEQVRLKAEKPSLAATPGTSNHGWGTAVDLCGGVESFDAPEHAWLLINAPAYGWFHPSWAEPQGSRPEPWHWEFGG